MDSKNSPLKVGRIVTDKPSNSIRKMPKQQRSKSIFEAILGATARVLTTTGFDKSTTNRIAEIAGISIGSLYQYFPNKEALVGALLERQVSNHVEVIEAEISVRPAEEEIVEQLIRAILGDIIKHKELLKVVGSQVFKVGGLNAVIDSRKRIEKTVPRLILENRDKMPNVKNIDQASYVIVSAVAGVAEAFIFDDIDDELQEKVVVETVELVRKYLS
jgi:AcrR family transcriptional regulator